MDIVLEGETPSINNETFLLREQIIGEIRGLKQVDVEVKLLQRQLTDKLKQQDENEKNTIQSDRD